MIHVQCGECGQWQIVGPGHPSVRFNPETGHHEFFDRSAAVGHGDGCGNDGSGPMALTFLAGVNVSGA